MHSLRLNIPGERGGGASGWERACPAGYAWLAVCGRVGMTPRHKAKRCWHGVRWIGATPSIQASTSHALCKLDLKVRRAHVALCDVCAVVCPLRHQNKCFDTCQAPPSRSHQRLALPILHFLSVSNTISNTSSLQHHHDAPTAPSNEEGVTVVLVWCTSDLILCCTVNHNPNSQPHRLSPDPSVQSL